MAPPKTPRKAGLPAQDTPFAESAPESDAPLPEDAAPEPGPAPDDIAAPDEPAEPAATSADTEITPHQEQAESVSDMAESPVAAPVASSARSGSGFFGLLAGGILAAVIGFGLARYVVPEGWPMPGTSPLQTQLERQAAEIVALRESVAKLAVAPAEDPQIAAIRNRADTAAALAQTALDAAQAIKIPTTPEPGPDLTPRLNALEARLAALEKRPLAEANLDLTALQQAVQTLRAELDARQSAIDAAVAEVAANARATLDAAQDEAEALKAEADKAASAALVQAALAQVKAALQSGAPYAEPLNRIADAQIPVPEVLTQAAQDGIPTLATLVESFADPARAALDASLRTNLGNSLWQRASNFVRTQTGARSLTPREGNDPDAILSRAEASLRKGDLPATLTEIGALPAPAQVALADWVSRAQHRTDALAAADALATTLSQR